MADNFVQIYIHFVQKHEFHQSMAERQTSYFMIVFTDVDECSQGTHSYSAYAVCTNTKGSYNCSCKTLYTGDGRNCTWLGDNPLILLWMGPRSFNDNDNEDKIYCESKYVNVDVNENGLKSRSMEKIIMITKSVVLTSMTMTLGRLY